MRLINITTLTLTEFFGANTPPYAILSHTWGPDEVSFQDFQTLSTARLKAGFAKIQGACTQALKEKLEWCWVDTCCIDKTSSAELSEAINSMYAWYGDAVVCYAYLSDIPDTLQESDLKEHSSGLNEAQKVLCASKWFTRGWTLQELLAPVKEVFFSEGWKHIGTRDSLGNVLAHVTGIERTYLNGYIQVGEASIAKRMSWMAKRETTRIEDLAYCLLGIFEVNMPLLYGEGQRAFTRLQETIMSQSDDQSIFCWVWDSKIMETSWGSILAPCPAAFAMSGHFRPAHVDPKTPVRVYNITNAGLSIWLPFILTPDWSFRFAALQVVSTSTSPGASHRACIPLNRLRIRCRIPYPAMPVLLRLDMADVGRNVYVKCKPMTVPRPVPSSRPNVRGDISYNETPCETLGNSHDFGFVFITKYLETNTMPKVLIGSENMVHSRNMITFSFSGKHASVTSGYVVFEFWTMSGMGTAWLAVRTRANADGTRQHNSYCGTPSEKAEYYQHIANNIHSRPEHMLKSGIVSNGRANTPAIMLGERIMYSSISKGSNNAQIAFFCNGSVQNPHRASHIADLPDNELKDIPPPFTVADSLGNFDFDKSWPFRPARASLEDDQFFVSQSPSPSGSPKSIEDVPSTGRLLPSPNLEPMEDIRSFESRFQSASLEPIEDASSSGKISPSPSPEPMMTIVPIPGTDPENSPHKKHRMSTGDSVLVHFMSNSEHQEETQQKKGDEVPKRVKKTVI